MCQYIIFSPSLLAIMNHTLICRQMNPFSGSLFFSLVFIRKILDLSILRKIQYLPAGRAKR